MFGFGKRREKPLRDVVFYTYPKLIFAWLLILVGFLFAVLDYFQLVPPNALGWMYAFVVFFTVLTMGVDLGRNVTVFWTAIAGCLILGILYLRDVRGVVVFSKIYSWLKLLDMNHNSHIGLMVSIGLAIPFLLMLISTRLNSKWRVTRNEFEHHSFGRVDDSLGRGAKCVRSSYPDWLELFLCLAGDLKIFDASGTRLLRTIPHVPMLPFVRKKIDRLMESMMVTPDVALEDTADHHDDHGGHENSDEDHSDHGEPDHDPEREARV